MEDKIRLERIQVKSLFNRFTYDINLKNGHDVAILIAPNGCGKTTILNLLDFTFKPTISKFRKVSITPFASSVCTLSNGIKIGIEVRKNEKPKKRGLEKSRNLYVDKDEEKALFLIIDDGEQHELNLTDAMQKSMKYFDDVDLQILDTFSDDYLKYLDIILEAFPVKYKSMYVNAARNLNINYISANRLSQPHYPVNKNRFLVGERGYEEGSLGPLQVMQEQIKDLCGKADSEYKELVSIASDLFPQMCLFPGSESNAEYDKLLLKARYFLKEEFLQLDNKEVSFKGFEKAWGVYSYYLDMYYRLGFIKEEPRFIYKFRASDESESKSIFKFDTTPEFQFILDSKKLEDEFKKNGAFLVTYLKAFGGVLEPLGRVYERLQLLIEILNSRNDITGKVFKFDPKKGITLTVDEEPLELECLSSGEKNDLIMFYNMIFYSMDGGLVLVDEPEISLHIRWQEDFLSWLEPICEAYGIRAIVATHSPSIINGRFELYAERGLTDEGK